MVCSVMFYNLENLYDTINDPNKDDDDFTPSGNKRWTQIKYQRKLENLGEVFQAVSSLPGGFPALVGVSEVENDNVLEDMVSQKRLSGAGYRFVHYDSNDQRGVDVALLYRSSRFKLIDSQPLKPILRSGREYLGRDILVVKGLLDGELFGIYVCHFLSRRGGRDSSAGFRRAGAETIYYHALQMRDENPGIKIIVMGDMNDTPADFSLSHLLHAVADMEDVEEGGFFNPMWTLMEEGQGTSLYNHRWTLFDNIVVCRQLLEESKSEGYHISMFGKVHYAQIFKRNFMMAHGVPKRSYTGKFFSGGYSDHLPVLIRLEK